jgi:hypothetical protein
MTTPDIHALMVTLAHEGALAVVVLLGRDGEIRRMGSIPMTPGEQGLYQGYIETALLDEALKVLPAGFYDSLGHFAQPEQEGQAMTLTVALRTADGEELPYILDYGSASTGPPQDLVAFVMHALTITQPWYDAQRGAAG